MGDAGKYVFTQLETKSMNRVRNQPEYVLDDGTFFLKDEYDQIMFGTDSIWIMVDIEDGTLHKHGPKERIQEHFDRFQTAMRNSVKDLQGDVRDVALQMADTMVMVEVTKVPLEEINHGLASTGYFKRVLEKYGYIQTGPQA